MPIAILVIGSLLFIHQLVRKASPSGALVVAVLTVATFYYVSSGTRADWQ